MNVAEFLRLSKGQKMRVSFLFTDSNFNATENDKKETPNFLRYNGAVNFICKRIKDLTQTEVHPIFMFYVSEHNYFELYQECYKVCQEDGDNSGKKYVMYFTNTKAFVEFLD